MGIVVSKMNIFNRFLNSVVGIFAGVLMILSMFVLAVVSETKENPAKIVKDATEISVENVWDNQGKLVVFHGNITANGKLDDIAIENASAFVSLISYVEVLAWVQHSEEKTTTSLGGTQETVTVYTYMKEWTMNIDTSFSSDTSNDEAKSLAIAENTALKTKYSHVNIGEKTKNNDNITIGDVKIKQDLAFNRYSAMEGSDLEGNLKEGYTVKGKYAYDVESTLRVSYDAIKSGTEGMAAGVLKKQGDDLVLTKYTSKKGSEIYTFAAWSLTKDNLVDMYDTQHKSDLWTTRMLIITLMGVGFALITKPLSVLLSVIPVLGKVGNAVLGFISTILGFIFGIVAILIGITFKYWFITLPLLAVLIIVLVVYAKKKKEEKERNEQQQRVNQRAYQRQQYRR